MKRCRVADEQRRTIAPHYSDSFIGDAVIPNGDFVLGDDGHFRRVVPDGQGGYRRDDDYFAPLRDGTITVPEHSAFEGTFRIVMSDVDPEDDSLDDIDSDSDLDEDDLCEHGLDWDDCDECSDPECPHGYLDDETCPVCDGESDDPEDLDGDPDDE
jgi:hypothetical protein